MRKELIGAVSALALLSGSALAAGTSGSTTADTSPSGGATITQDTSPAQTPSMQPVSPGQVGKIDRVSAEQMLGKTVVGTDGQELGEVADVILDPQSGQAQHLVIASGGFLGIGEKQIAVEFQSIQWQPGEDQIRATNLTQAQVENLQEFEYEDNMVSLNRGAADAPGAARPKDPPGTTSDPGDAPSGETGGMSDTPERNETRQ